MIARSGLSAESLQVLTAAANRLGSEDGLEGVTDGAQELQLRLAEAVHDMHRPGGCRLRQVGVVIERFD